MTLTVLQCVIEVIMVHVLQEVRSHFQHSLSDTVQISFILVLLLILSVGRAIWTKEPPKPVQLILHQSYDFLLQLLIGNI